MSKADNMLSILWLLRSGKRVTAQQLADDLEIHVRTVYRCIDSLCASGAPIIADSGPNGGYRLLGEFVDSPLLFDSEDIRPRRTGVSGILLSFSDSKSLGKNEIRYSELR